MAQLTQKELKALSKKLKKIDEKYPDRHNNYVSTGNTDITINHDSGENINIGKILESSDLNGYGIPTTIFVDVIRLEIVEGKNKSFYIRFGALLDYLENQIFPKIANPNTSGTKEEQEIKIKSMAGLTGNPYLKVDTDTNTNIMYTIDNQLSTNPQVCVIKNNIQTSNGSTTLFHGLEDYIGVQGDIKYGKVMNIYINTTYLNDLVASGGVASSISIYKFLNEICEDINDSLGGVNNLEPTIDEASNTIIIREQTKIPGKKELIKTLGINPIYKKDPPILEVFGYNEQKSNFVRNAGITTSITKEYATMITIGATAGGYIPGEEATAFSRWNVGIEDRFKKDITGPDIDQTPTISSFDTDNEGIIEKYFEYINQNTLNLIGINSDDEVTDKETDEEISSKSINTQMIKSNTSTVVNFNKYLQASASISNPEPENVESSIGFLPFNLNLTMDGLGGIKIYNRLDVNVDFLPSNYPQALEFIITGVDHKLSNSSWETSLNTLGTSKGTTKPSTISIPKSQKSPSESDSDSDNKYPRPPKPSNQLSYQEKLNSLDPAMKPKVEKVIETLKLKGFQPKLFFAHRTLHEQQEIFKKGHSKVKFSFHTAYKNGKPNAYAVDIIDKRWAWEGGTEAQRNSFWKALGEAGKKEGLYWGGDWKSFKDWAHLQFYDNNMLAQVKTDSNLGELESIA